MKTAEIAVIVGDRALIAEIATSRSCFNGMYHAVSQSYAYYALWMYSTENDGTMEVRQMNEGVKNFDALQDEVQERLWETHVTFVDFIYKDINGKPVNGKITMVGHKDDIIEILSLWEASPDWEGVRAQHYKKLK